MAEKTVVFTVSCDTTADPLGVTLDGLNEQVTPIGRFAVGQLKLTDWLKPLAGVTVTFMGIVD